MKLFRRIGLKNQSVLEGNGLFSWLHFVDFNVHHRPQSCFSRVQTPFSRIVTQTSPRLGSGWPTYANNSLGGGFRFSSEPTLKLPGLQIVSNGHAPRLILLPAPSHILNPTSNPPTELPLKPAAQRDVTRSLESRLPHNQPLTQGDLRHVPVPMTHCIAQTAARMPSLRAISCQDIFVGDPSD